MITLNLKRTARGIDDPAVGSFIPGDGEPFLVESEVVSSCELYTEDCATQAQTSTKVAKIKNKDFGLFDMSVGQTVFVKFTHGNSVINPMLSIVTSVGNITAPKNIAYYGGNDFVTDIFNSRYNWDSGETRAFTYNGTYWVIQIPDEFMGSPLLFVGNGISTIESLYNSGEYMPVSKYISSDMIKNGSITISKIDPEYGIASKEDLQELSEAVDELAVHSEERTEDLSTAIALNKLYHATCDTYAGVQKKSVTIPNLPIINTFGFYDGLTLVVSFSNENTAISPTLEVVSSVNNTVLIPECPLYVGSVPLGRAFFWKKNDSVIFSYNSHDNRWYMSSTSASSVIASWCSDNNTTFINGGMIATGSISADSIQAGSITADQIAVGSLPATVFNSTIQSAVENLNEFKQRCASAGTIVAECHSSANSAYKDVSMGIEDFNSIQIGNNGYPLVGTSIVVKFDNANTYINNKVYLRVAVSDNGQSPSYAFSGELGFYIDNAFINIGGVTDNNTIMSNIQSSAIGYYAWVANGYRTIMWDGSNWVLSVTTKYLSDLATWCLQNGQTWIGGGTIVTGTIVADQIQSGSINTAKVSLECIGEYNGDIASYGGVRYYRGTAGDLRTDGIQMYGAINFDDPDQEPDYNVTFTNNGMSINTYQGRIGGWSSKIMIDAGSGVEIGASSNSSNNFYTSAIKIGNIVDASNMSTTTVFGKLKLPNLPTSDPHVSGQLYLDSSNSIKVSTG